MSNLKLYCASLVGYDGSVISTQSTHVVAENDEDAFRKGCTVFENMYKDPQIKRYISCIELSMIEGHQIAVC